jgi:hypothetical protein
MSDDSVPTPCSPPDAIVMRVSLRPVSGEVFRVRDSAVGWVRVGGRDYLARVFVTPDRLTEGECRPLLIREFAAGRYYWWSSDDLAQWVVGGQPDEGGCYSMRVKIDGKDPVVMPPLSVT